MARNHNDNFQYFLTILCLAFVVLSCWAVEPCNGGEQNKNKKRNQSTKEGKFLKGMFVFGSSVVDNGNNNYVKDNNLSKVNYKPYGIDFPFGPTGRYTNGKNVADSIADILHLPLVPPFAAPNTKGVNVLSGVNYGSGGCGILDDTGSISPGIMSMNQQIKNFEEVTLPELKALLGGNLSREKLGQYLFVIAAGNNDFEMNYFLQESSSRPSVPIFVKNLTITYNNQLKRLYNVGARKFALLNVYPIGCTPVVMEESGSQNCIQIVNLAARYFNVQLKNLVDDFRQNNPGSEFVLVNTYKIIRDIIKNPAARGFSNVTSACCELKKVLGVGILCKEYGQLCRNRNNYVFFDGQHNTQAVNALIATKAFSSNRKSEAYPFNLQKLAGLIVNH